MLRKVAICAVLATTLVVAGCGSSGDETSEEDTQAITELVDDLNLATREKDASAFCLIIQPSAVEETFLDIDRCVRETEPILEAAGDQPQLEIESIEVDGDIAKVTFTGSAGGEANFVKEDGRWFVPLNSGEAGATAEPVTSGEEG